MIMEAFNQEGLFFFEHLLHMLENVSDPGIQSRTKGTSLLSHRAYIPLGEATDPPCPLGKPLAHVEELPVLLST